MGKKKKEETKEKKTSIQISKLNWKWLLRIKTKLFLESFDDLITKIRKMVIKLKLQKELEDD